MTATTTNGRPRRQLADQLDRLDGLIDLLAVNLNEAVADACRDGARAAVREAVIEVLTSPDLRARLAAPRTVDAPPQSAPPPPAAWVRLKARLAALRDRVRPAVAARYRDVAPAVAAAGRTARLGWRLRTPLLVAAAAGVLVGAAVYLAPPAVAASVAGVGGSGLALAVQGGLWARAAARRYGLL
ncbi:hypothetical protein [Urbifossiella limnaea]|uniref:Uncharacterized protein n=1 Tax=Urbifossiella limnaea TaxID=2528023 RepID=A0A517XNA0_9BACT|nr:hypothetical protein [Urbifossiella limnaea]QDU18967.1 hypothetical protein ETAA1_08670 [Urbifossiella limnaea]